MLLIIKTISISSAGFNTDVEDDSDIEIDPVQHLGVPSNYQPRSPPAEVLQEPQDHTAGKSTNFPESWDVDSLDPLVAG